MGHAYAVGVLATQELPNLLNRVRFLDGVPSPCSSADRALASEAMRVGSSPAKDAIAPLRELFRA